MLKATERRNVKSRSPALWKKPQPGVIKAAEQRH